MAARSWSRSLAAAICVPAYRAANFKACCMASDRFRGSRLLRTLIQGRAQWHRLRSPLLRPAGRRNSLCCGKASSAPSRRPLPQRRVRSRKTKLLWRLARLSSPCSWQACLVGEFQCGGVGESRAGDSADSCRAIKPRAQSAEVNNDEVVTLGVVDAIAWKATGISLVVIWKSDLDPNAATLVNLEHRCWLICRRPALRLRW